VKQPINLPPPEDVWLSHTTGQYDMKRTSHKDEAAIRYVLGSSHDQAIAYIERMTGENNADPVSALVDLRFALGDNAKRSIPELIEYAKTLAAGATP
jgi:hypothetical protein